MLTDSFDHVVPGDSHAITSTLVDHAAQPAVPGLTHRGSLLCLAGLLTALLAAYAGLLAGKGGAWGPAVTYLLLLGLSVGYLAFLARPCCPARPARDWVLLLLTTALAGTAVPWGAAAYRTGTVLHCVIPPVLSGSLLLSAPAVWAAAALCLALAAVAAAVPPAYSPALGAGEALGLQLASAAYCILALLAMTLMARQRLRALQGQVAQLRLDVATLEELLRGEQERHSAAAQTSDDIVNMLAHEIRTPLQSLLAACEMMQLTVLSRKQKGYVRDMALCGAQIMSNMTAVLEAQRLAGAKLPLKDVRFTVGRLLAHSAAMVRHLAVSKSLELACTAGRFRDLGLEGDFERLAQVTINLLNNAIKFTPEHGRVSLVAEVHFLEGSGHRCLLAVEVQDTGPGMSEEAQAGLFRRFAQADEAVYSKFGGSGLGLWICHRIIEGCMDGTLEVVREKTALGAGSTFRFAVPLPLTSRPETPVLGAVEGLDSYASSPANERFAGLLHSMSSPVSMSRMASAAGLPVCPFADAISEASEVLPEEQSCWTREVSEVPSDAACVQSTARRSHFCSIKSRSMLGCRQPFQSRQATSLLSISGKSHSASMDIPTHPLVIDAPMLPHTYTVPRFPDSPEDAGAVLVVDDDPVSCRLLTEMLLSLGYADVQSARTVEQAVELFVKRYPPYRVVLSDYHIGTGDGGHLTGTLRQFETELGMEPTLILGMTGDPQAQGWKGVSRVLTKPFSRALLKQSLLLPAPPLCCCG